MPVCCRRNRVAALVFGLLAVTLLGVGPRSAAGDPIADKKAEAARIASRVDELNAQIGIVAEEYNAARIELDTIQANITAAQARVAETEAAMVQRRTQLQNYAV